MGIVELLLIGSLVTWVTLMIVVPIAGRLAEFSFPGWGTAAWQLAVVALVTNAATAALQPVSGLLGTIVGLIVFWGLMVKWFEVNLLGAVLIVVISWVVRFFLFAFLLAAMGGAG